MDADDSIACIELTGEEALLLQPLQVVADFFGKTISLFFQFLWDRLAPALLGRHLRAASRSPICGQMIEVLHPVTKPAVLRADDLRVALVVPEIGSPHPLLERSDVAL